MTVQWLQDGGPMMLAIVALSAVGLPLALLWGALQGLRIRVPASAWVVVPVGVVCLGLVGTSLGVVQTLTAVGHASEEVKQTLLVAGISISLITSASGWLVAGILLIASAWLLATATAIRPGPGASWTPLHALAPLALGLVGMVFAPWSVGVGLAVVTGGAAVAVAAARWPGDREPTRDARRVATARVTVGVVAALGAYSVSQFVRLHSVIEALEALARAAPDMRSTMLQDLGAVAALGGRPGLWVGGLLLLATIAVAVPVRRWLVDSRAVAGAVSMALLLLLPVISSVWLGRTLDGIDVRTAEDLQHEARRAAGVRLPLIDSEVSPDLAVTVLAGVDDLVVDGVPIGWGGERSDGLHQPLYLRLVEKAEVARDLAVRAGGEFDSMGELDLEADRDLRWSTLVPVLDSAVAAGFVQLDVHGVRDGQLRSMRVALDGEEGEHVVIEGDPRWSEVVDLLGAARRDHGAVVLRTGP